MTTTDSSTIDSPPTPAPFAAERRAFVLFSIFVVAVMFVGMVGLLYWRERPAASALLVVRVPLDQDGTIATVAPRSGDLPLIIKTLKGGEEVRIPLPPGEYVVKFDNKGRKLTPDLGL